KTHAGKVYYQGPGERSRYYFFPDERTAIVANREADLHRFIDAGNAGAAQAGWAKAWKSVQSHHFAAVVNLAAGRQGGGEGGQPSVQPLVTALGPLGEKATTLVVCGTFDNGLALTANVTCATAEDGEKVRETVEAWLARGRAAIARGRQTMAADAR